MRRSAERLAHPYGRHVVRAVLIPFVLTFLASPSFGIAQSPQDAELSELINSTTNPLPIIPVVVPELQSPQMVDNIVSTGNLPTLFQISQPNGPYEDPAKIRFFQLMALEYPLKVNFRKLAAGSTAALHLYDGNVSKPVYILCDPSRPIQDRFALINEAAMPEGHEVKQTTIENFIYRRLGIKPTLLTTTPLTDEDLGGLVSKTGLESAKSGQPAKPILVLFFREEAGVPGPVNRLRVLLALERFFYTDRLRIAECDVSNAGGVYRALLSTADNPGIPNGAELWLIDPATHNTVKYEAAAGKGSLMDELTASALQAWLVRSGIAAPPDRALDVYAAWQELAALDGQTKGN